MIRGIAQVPCQDISSRCDPCRRDFSVGDVHGEALSYNCIGVDYMKLGETDKPEFYREAIEFHNKHKEIADVAGKFLAHINLGIIFNNIGDHEKATINHHFALRYAV